MKFSASSKVGVLCIGLLSVASTSLAEEGTWTTRSPMPTATSLHSASVLDGKIYIVGGTDTIYRVATDYFSTVRMYDPTAGTWTEKADMAAGRARGSTSVVDGKIYAIGGSPHGNADLATVEVYDPATDTWTRKSDMPRARCFLSTSVVNGRIYVIGGKTYPSEDMVSTVEEYDPATDTWTRKADMPAARGQHSAAVVDGKIYVIGGAAGTFGPVVSTVEAYDPTTDTWSKRADMPTARFFASTSVVNGRIYTIGGGNAWGPALSMVEVYDPTTDTWSTRADIPTGRATHSASVVDGKIYVIGGTLGIEPWVPTSTVEVYDPNPLVVDFNGDEIVDIEDLVMLIESWGQDEPSLDIAPRPFGDGIVDAADLEVLMSYWGQEVPNPALVARWKLDEAEGMAAADSAGDHDGTVVGSPAWQPAGGSVGGALEFDGMTFVVADSVLNPANGPFSAFAWVKGGAPGQAILSQQAGVNWLLADPATGALMTELRSGGRQSRALSSQADITDGNWHRVGFAWDGSNRELYMDDILVAEDAQVAIESSTGALLIGCGSAMTPATNFTGLIDDVRIYDRAVEP